jgi:hypothetical protein
LIVVVFGRIGGERGGAERNPSANYGNGGGEVAKGEAIEGRQVVRVATAGSSTSTSKWR